MSYKKIIFILCLSIFLSSERGAIAQSATFSYVDSVQTWTVPCATQITITANGAQGGTCVYGSGGLGAQIIGTFTVTPGQVLKVLVGQEGTGGPVGSDYFYCGSGGGGTYVWDASNTSLPMIVAGGGGGGSDNGNGSAGVGSATQTPTPASGGQGSVAGGSGGNGGAAGAWSGSGAGWLSNGGNGSNANGGASPSNGGAGGSYNNPGYTGGFGGGGGCNGNNGSGGGGGGYNGGGGGIGSGNWSSGGGGGSYNGGTNQSNTAGSNSANGNVTITWNNAVIPVTVTGNVLANEATCDGLTGKAYGAATGIGLTYSWTGGQTRDTATGLSAGSYTITVNSACGGSASASVTITQPANVITASASVVSNVFCNGGNDGSASASVNGVGSPYVYSWSNGQTTSSAITLTAGTYSVVVSNICGATASATVTISQPPSLSLTAISTGNVLCNGGNNGSAFATAHSGTPPYAYSWAPFGGITDSAVALTSGGYTITLTDANGCTGSASVVITQPNVLVTSALVNNEVLCYGTNTGNLITTPNGGTGPYTYKWTGGQTNANAANLPAGTYTVDVTDANGCTTSAAAAITQPQPVQVTQGWTLDSGACTGSAWVTVSGGVPLYHYLWSNGSSSYYLHYVCHDTFCYTVTDANGCKDSGCISVPTDLGVANIASNAGKISVYPNPNSGQFTIESTITGSQWNVEVYNVLGEKVYSQKAISNSQVTVNIGTQPDGIYLYRVISSDNGSLLGEGKLEITR